MGLNACYCPADQEQVMQPELAGEYVHRYFEEMEQPDNDALESHRNNTDNKDQTRSVIMKTRPRLRGRRRQEQPRNMHNYAGGVTDTSNNDDFRNTSYWAERRAADKRHLKKMVNQGFNGNWVQWSKGLGYQEPTQSSGPNPAWFVPLYSRQTYQGSASNENSNRAGYGYYGMTNPMGRPLHSGFW